ncbi:hypothetical protein TH63_18865 [Rufibacter radiotolerans]|uniref:Uncharacterized protein n=1 Tax=Rufibacter radiotolerans TaxID=1379910 RepID=A0A0H4W9T6_9BACT|nr:hypothetical protein TH63_18865 [Rufibacter radiotolerans]
MNAKWARQAIEQTYVFLRSCYASTQIGLSEINEANLFLCEPFLFFARFPKNRPKTAFILSENAVKWFATFVLITP